MLMMSCKPMYRLTLSGLIVPSGEDDAESLSKGMHY